MAPLEDSDDAMDADGFDGGLDMDLGDEPDAGVVEASGASGAVDGEAAVEEAPVSADGWRDLMDGKIRLRIVREGSGPHPEMNQDVRCSFDVWLADDESRSILQRRKDVRYRIGEGEAIPALELALRNMRVGGEVEAFGVANMAWGPGGCPAIGDAEREVPPNSSVRLRVHLHECIQARGEGEASWTSKIQEVSWRKANGNDHFRRRFFQKASKCYTAGCDVFQGVFEPPDHVENKAAAAAVAASLAADCGANLAAVHLELGKNVEARDAAAAVLEISPENKKALYRKAKACLALDEFEEVEAALQKLLALEPDEPAAKRLQVELRKKKQQYASQSKRVAANFFKGLEYPDQPPPPEEPAEPRWPLIQEARDFVADVVSRLRWWHGVLLLAIVVAVFCIGLTMQPSSRIPFYFTVAFLIPGPALALLTADSEDAKDKEKKKKDVMGKKRL